ncbi:MAG: hypothetical protein E3J94_05540 [Desulfobacteraceae bacterium]|nr:MAG: hypothetical protein E3J94_05540 [Desulfobacteraceae bacterium]
MKCKIGWFIMIAVLLTFLVPYISLSKQEQRIALVIGNGSYKSSPLANPVNDANDMADALERCNFTVMKKINATRREMRRAIRKFGHEIKSGVVGLFYYAGHGIQVKGENYLVPIGAEVYSEDEVEDECLKVSSVLRKMETAGNRLNIIILDACRDNPFGRSFRSGNRGLAKMDAPTGSILAYATAPGSVAADGIGRNGLYTSKLLKHMMAAGLEIGKLFRQVRIDVMHASGKSQVPWESSSLTGEFSFIPERAIAVVKRPKKEPKQPVLTTKVKPRDELELALAKIEEKEEARRKTKEALVQKYKQLFEDVKKYEKIKASDLDKETKMAAWGVLKRKYPEWADGVEPGDSDTFVSRALAEDIDVSFLELALDEGIKLTITNSIGMKFVSIPAGTFMMGSPSDEPGRDNDERQHRVTLSKGFYMQATEVTQGQWQSIMGNNPSYFENCGDNCPVEKVSWNDCQDFIRRLNQKEGTNKYRLPTEAEWEYACRAGSTTPFYTGTCISTDQANYDGDYSMPGCPRGEDREKTVRAGSFQPNLWVLYDMHGNVWEWCQDWYGDYPTGQVTDPKGPSYGDSRVIRGGGWFNDARYCGSAYRSRNDPDIRGHYGLGFRVARDF